MQRPELPSHPPAELPSLARFADQLAGSRGRASAGATAALAAALAADLVTQVAERSSEWPESRGAIAQADALRERATASARDVAVAYQRVLEALDGAVGGSLPAASSDELQRRLHVAADLLLEVGETAADSAALALEVARSGDTIVRADATSAAVLAAASAEMTAHLVDVNLLSRADDERTTHARRLATAAAGSRATALELA